MTKRYRAGTITAGLAAAAVLLGPAVPLAAKTCKEPISAKSSSRIAGDDAKRDERAKDNAIKRWVKDAQAKYGVAYRFWIRSEERSVDCGRGKNTSHCTVTAKPCRLL